MRYSPDRKAETRKQIIKAAGALAKKDGFGTTGVDGLMSAAGLKGSSFYHHFSTKGELLKDIIENEIDSSRQLLMGNPEATRKDLLRQLLGYMSMQHLANPEYGCALPTLSAEVARADAGVKQAYEEAVLKVHDDMQALLGENAAAWPLLALNVGAIILARAMASPDTQKQLLKECRDFARQTIAGGDAPP